MENLPVELVQNISFYLTNRDILKLSASNKKLNSILTSSEFLRLKTILDFGREIAGEDWYICKYNEVLNTYCISCRSKCYRYTRTFDYNVCLDCERNVVKYQMISQTRAMKDFFLKKEDLENIKKYKHLNDKSKESLKFLDVVNYTKKKYTNLHLYSLKKQESDKMFFKTLVALKRFELITMHLVNYCKVDISVINRFIYFHINDSTRNRWKLYLKGSKNKNFLHEIIQKCLLLEWFYHNLEDYQEYFIHYPENTIRSCLMSGIILGKKYCMPKIGVIKTVIRENKEDLKRKILILEGVRELKLENIDIDKLLRHGYTKCYLKDSIFSIKHKCYDYGDYILNGGNENKTHLRVIISYLLRNAIKGQKNKNIIVDSLLLNDLSLLNEGHENFKLIKFNLDLAMY